MKGTGFGGGPARWRGGARDRGGCMGGSFRGWLLEAGLLLGRRSGLGYHLGRRGGLGVCFDCLQGHECCPWGDEALGEHGSPFWHLVRWREALGRSPTSLGRILFENTIMGKEPWQIVYDELGCQALAVVF